MVNDTRTMGDTLKQFGLSVMLAENQTRQAKDQQRHGDAKNSVAEGIEAGF